MKRILFVVFLFFICLTACKKEYSLEDQQSEMQADTINCNSIAVYGDYVESNNLTDTNYITCQVNVMQPGRYKAYSDTVNGFYFLDTGLITTPGLKTLTIQGYGQMQAADFTNFRLHFNNSVCSFSILPSQAEYIFTGSNNNCEGNFTFGSYKAGQLLTVEDSVVVQLNVTTPGLYNFQTSVINGIQFFASGNFTDTGTQSVTMAGKGTPASGGNFEFPVTALHSACSFFIATDYKTIDTSMHYSFDVDGKHYAGYLDSASLSNLITQIGLVNVLSFATLITGSTDTLFDISLSRINMDISSGVYHPAIISNEDYAGGMDFSTSQSFIYHSVNDLPAFQINLLTYTNPGELVDGEFQGPVVNDKGQVVQMTNGTFQTYLSH